MADIENGLNMLNASLQSVSNTIGAANLDRRNREFAQQEAEKQREWNEQMWVKTNAWNEEMWSKTNEYNDPTHQVQRLRDAGLNPLYYGLDGTSANAFQASQPLGYSRADYQSTINPAAAGNEMLNAARSVAKDIELKNAQIDKLKAESTGVGLDNQWKDKTLDARSQASELANSMTKEQIAQVRKQMDKTEQEIKESIARTDNEMQKKGLIIAETALRNAEEKEIVTLLPFKQLLTEAQTDAQKASAASSYASAAINNGLLKAGYVDKQIDSLVADIRQKNASADSVEAQKAINEWKMSIRNGTTFNPDNYPTAIQGVLAQLTNGFFGIISTASEALGGGLSGFIK